MLMKDVYQRVNVFHVGLLLSNGDIYVYRLMKDVDQHVNVVYVG